MTETTKKPPIGLFVAIGAVLALLAFLFITYTNAVAFGVRHEKAIEATQTNNRNILASNTTAVMEMAQVPGMMRDDLSKVMQDAFEGRYGENGSQAAVQLIVENYPGQIDPGLYRAIQSKIEAGRNEFKNNQTRLLEQKRVYETNLGYVVKGFWLRTAGFPKIDLDKITIVSSTAADRAFETGIDDGVTLRPAAAQ